MVGYVPVGVGNGRPSGPPGVGVMVGHNIPVGSDARGAVFISDSCTLTCLDTVISR